MLGQQLLMSITQMFRNELIQNVITQKCKLKPWVKGIISYKIHKIP